MKIRRPVIVKMILTEASKNQLLQQMDEELRRIQIEMEQLQFERRKLLAIAEKKGQEAIQFVQEKMDEEMEKRETARREQEIRRQTLYEMPIESELITERTETEFDVQIGQNWYELMQPVEVIIRDGIVVEIRGE